ncbi:MAG TPA: luciferase family protein [Cyclobacteriaceae bacterium]|nr:luciferase family protein [Cyclobacteriaceae bacterium]
MFDFVVKYFGFLKHVPGLPHFFDSFLKIHTSLSDSSVLDYCDEIENEVLLWDRMSVSTHKFGGVQFNLGSKEIGHIHGNGLLDILFNREIKNRLLVTGRVSDHHVFRDSGWVSVWIRKSEDKLLAIELLRQSYDLRK